MRWLADLTVAFLLLGVMEAVAPLLFSWLDPLLPELLQQLSGPDLEQVVRQKLEGLTGERWSRRQVESVFALFDPRAAADHALSRLGDEAFSLWLEQATPEELKQWQP